MDTQDSKYDRGQQQNHRVHQAFAVDCHLETRDDKALTCFKITLYKIPYALCPTKFIQFSQGEVLYLNAVIYIITAPEHIHVYS